MGSRMGSSMGMPNFGFAEKEEAKKWMLHKLQQIEKRCFTKIKEFRAEVMSDACKFIQMKLEPTLKLLTTEHHRIIKFYQLFKTETA